MLLTALVSTPPGRPRGRSYGAWSPQIFGMALFLVSLGVLFAATLVGYAWVRVDADEWPPPDAVPLPATLWASTALLVLSSGTMHAACVGARRGRQQLLRGGMIATTLLGLAFMASQAAIWLSLLAQQMTPTGSLYANLFYTLTALHAAHVIGGLVGLVVVTVRAFLGYYSAASQGGVWRCAMYWHFLDAVWLVLFTVLVLLP